MGALLWQERDIGSREKIQPYGNDEWQICSSNLTGHQKFHSKNGAVRAKTMKNLSGLAINQIETIFDNRKETEKKSTYGSRREYSEYLNNKYACLTPTKDSSVSINSSLHSKEASNPKTAEWLENTLSQMPDYINKICENSAKNVKRNGESYG